MGFTQLVESLLQAQLQLTLKLSLNVSICEHVQGSEINAFAPIVYQHHRTNKNAKHIATIMT